MKNYGYNLTEETKYGAYYEKSEPQNYTHVVCVLHKHNGKHIMQSYDKEVLKISGKYVCDGVGVEIPVLFLMWLKAKKLGVKYHWNKHNLE